MHGIYAYTHACLRAYTHTYTNAYMHTCVHTCAHTQCGGKKPSAHTHRHDIDTIIQRAENSPPRPPYPRAQSQGLQRDVAQVVEMSANHKDTG